MSHTLVPKLYDLGVTFGVSAWDGVALVGFEPSGHADIPALDPDYVFDPDALLALCLWWLELGERTLAHRTGEALAPVYRNHGFWLYGRPGAGKTTLVLQWAARLNIPLPMFAGRKNASFEDLCYTKEIVTREETLTMETRTSFGVMVLAAQLGVPMLWNELDGQDPDELVGVHDLIEHGVLKLPDGRTIVAKPGFGVVAACNTNGSGDHTGEFPGTRPQSAALRSRFEFYRLESATVDSDIALLKRRHPALTDKVCEVIAKTADMSRVAVAGTDANVTAKVGRPDVAIDRRTMLLWARKVEQYVMAVTERLTAPSSADPHWSIKRALTAACDSGAPGSREALQMCLDLCLP